MIETICICGAGTMGSGIAHVAAQSGFKTILFDVNPEMTTKARSAIEKNLQTLIEKDRITVQVKDSTFGNVRFSSDIEECVADIIIEAIIENIEAKVELFNQLARYNNNKAVFATNTSSLSINELALQLADPSRFAGMHFFNPPYLMKLVEVVKGEQTSDEIVQGICNLATRFGKMPVVCKDSPGFIVNRVARAYYLEALKLLETGLADIETIDQVMEASGFKMGPFRLM